MKKTLTFLYPFFFALYPILELRNHNMDYVDTSSLFRPILLSLLLTAVIWGLLRLFIKDWHKAGILATLAIIMFFSYGHAYLQYEAVFGDIPRHRHLILFFGGIFVLIAVWLIWKVKNTEGIVNFLLATGGLLLAFSLFQSLRHDISVYQAAQSSDQSQSVEAGSTNASLQKPDIYFILLDAHTRSDVLRNSFNYDNSAFIQQLKDLGFYVAECAQSNYPATKLSVTSTFYADYHHEPTLYPVYSSLTIKTVRSLGYKVITFENRSNGHFDIGEDMRLSRNQMAFGRIDLTGGLSEFDMMLLKTSFLRIAIDMPQLIPGMDDEMLQKTEYYEHYQQTYYILDELSRLPKDVAGPKFVFAHILVPHAPFIFTPDGKFHWAEKAKDGYVSNVQFIDSHLIPVLEQIIKNSEVPPVILIMGDHGPTGIPVTHQERMSILNAYYVNDKARKDLYETITPVNSFRVILNNYFGTDYPLLEDVSYHAYGMNQFTPENVIPNTCQVGQ